LGALTCASDSSGLVSLSNASRSAAPKALASLSLRPRLTVVWVERGASTGISVKVRCRTDSRSYGSTAQRRKAGLEHLLLAPSIGDAISARLFRSQRQLHTADARSPSTQLMASLRPTLS